MEHASGCLICGAELRYRTAAETMACAVCGKEFPSTAACANGHFVCDGCHGMEALDWIEARCRTSGSRDPIALANELMAHPAVKMHGPEHHFLFPAVMVAAWSNATGQLDQKAARLALARQRSQIVPGGFCGFQGACGAGIGMGIFWSVVTGATPVAKAEWGQANALTGRALVSIAAHGGPRCCKRDGWLALSEAIATLKREAGVDLSPATAPRCGFSSRNKECTGTACPYFSGSVPAGFPAVASSAG